MKRIVPILLLATGAFAQTATQIEKDIRTLAAPNMEGRGLDTNGIKLAADYIESRVRALGLAPAFPCVIPSRADGEGSRADKRCYRQPFPVKIGVALGKNNRLEGVGADDWSPLGFSSSGTFKGEVAFVGYGISAPPLNYDDFAGIDLKGKVALMLRYEPQEKDEASPFDGRKPSRWSAMRYKVLQARERGAVAVVFVTGPLQDEGKDKVPPLANDGPESPAGIPVLQVKTSLAQKWVDLAAFQKDVDKDLQPRSRVLPMTLAGTADVIPTNAQGENIAGVLPGKGALASEIVVLGAHYDHLGYGGEGSMKPNVKAIHPGADDNASGTAGVLSAAAIVRDALKNVPSHRTIFFMLFSGEERGLAGSG